MNFNKCILGGRLTRDPESRVTQTGTPVCEFGLAVNEKRKDNEKSHFFDCTAFGKTAEMIGEHFRKGREILIDGRLDFQSWEDKNGGGKRSKIQVIVENFQFVGPREQAGGAEDAHQPAPPPTRRPQQSAPSYPLTEAVRQKFANRPAPQQPFGDQIEFSDDSIPF